MTKLISLLTALVSAVVAADNVVRITTSSGEPVPYARIRSAGAFATSWVFSDSKGEWHLEIPVIGGSSCSMFSPTLVTSISKPGYAFDKTSFAVPCGGFQSLTSVIGTGTPLPSSVTVSAASYNRTLAPQMIVAAFGDGLANTIEGAGTLPPPTTLGGRRVILIGPDGVEYTCRLLYVSPGQINFILPAIPQTVNLGQNSLLAAIDIRDENGTIREEGIVLKRASPALFSANSSGAGVAAGGLLRVRTDGSMAEEPIAQLDPAQNKLVPIPIEFTSDTQRLTLSIFGTGFGSSGRVEANIDGMGVPVLFAGEQQELQGLVRIDLELGRMLAGGGEVPIQIIVDGNPANQVTIGFR